jgi:hypothetical protein
MARLEQNAGERAVDCPVHFIDKAIAIEHCVLHRKYIPHFLFQGGRMRFGKGHTSLNLLLKPFALRLQNNSQNLEHVFARAVRSCWFKGR